MGSRYPAAPFIVPEDLYDVEAYEELLERAVEELWVVMEDGGPVNFGVLGMLRMGLRLIRGARGGPPPVGEWGFSATAAHLG